MDVTCEMDKGCRARGHYVVDFHSMKDMFELKNRGKEMYDFCKKIFRYCRSITGEGVRQTLAD